MAENYMPKYRTTELDVTRELLRVATIIITTIACFQVELVVQKKSHWDEFKMLENFFWDYFEALIASKDFPINKFFWHLFVSSICK